MDCSSHTKLPRPCPVTDRVLPLINLLKGEGEDNFNAVPHAGEFLSICEGPLNDSFERYILKRLFHEMEIFKSDISVHFRAISHYLKMVCGKGSEIFPDDVPADQGVAAMSFKGNIPSYKEVKALVKSISRLHEVANRFHALVHSDLDSDEISKKIRSAIDYWDCPCADVSDDDGSITITHKPMECCGVPLKEAGYNTTNIKALSGEVDHGLNTLAGQLQSHAHHIDSDIDVKDRSEVGYDYNKDIHSLTVAVFCYNVLAQMIECSMMAVSDVFKEFSDFVRKV